ncbi:MAG: NAD(+) synthase [Pseudomonadota bacterium]
MSWRDWKYALVQFNPVPGALEHNASRIIALGRAARDLGADVVIFPETALPGYCIADLHKDMSFVRRNRRILEETLAPALADVVTVLGYIDVDDVRRMADGLPARRNRYAVCQGGRVLATGTKTLLVDDGVLEDSRHYLPGDPDEVRPVEVVCGGRRLRIGVLICQDLWDDEAQVKPALLQRDRGAEILVAINSSPFHVGRLADRRAVAAARVRETGLPLLYANTVGAQDNGKNIILFDGGGFALGPDGGLLAQGPLFDETPVLFDPAAPATSIPPLEPVDELHRALVMGIADFYVKTGVFRGAVIGLSGGIDSTVDAALLVEALGADRVLGVNMPSRFNSDITRGIAADLAGNLGIEYLVHPIQEIVDAKVAAWRRATGSDLASLTLENIQARERGNILMTASQERRFMVVGNGNKTEFQRGYATLYGDIVGALMPLGDVHKLDVYRLGRHLNGLLDGAIPEAVFGIKASAELSDAQDVSRGGGDPFDYHVEAPLGVELVERGRSPEELAALFQARELDPLLWVRDGTGRLVYDKLTPEAFRDAALATLRAIRSSVFKRVQAPPILVVSPRAFGFDFREALLVRDRC